jgi:uncharacterized protein (DUF302 family)
MATDGLTTIPSSFGPKVTTDRLEAEIKAKGMTVFARIDHAAGAAELGLPLRPTELLIFGSAKAGTPLMQASQAIGIDLPLKALVFEDAAGKVWLSYNDPRWLAQRHGLAAADVQSVDAMAARGWLARQFSSSPERPQSLERFHLLSPEPNIWRSVHQHETRFASFGNDSIWRAMDRTIACPFQRGGS